MVWKGDCAKNVPEGEESEEKPHTACYRHKQVNLRPRSSGINGWNGFFLLPRALKATAFLDQVLETGFGKGKSWP